MDEDILLCQGAYKMIRHCETEEARAIYHTGQFILKQNAPPLESADFCLASQTKASNASLHEENVCGSLGGVCSIECIGGEEDCSHVLFECPFAQRI